MTPTKWFATAAVAAALSLTVTPHASADAQRAAHQDRALLPSLPGRYRFVGGAREVKARDAALDEAVSGMNILVRGMARRRLAEVNTIPENLAVAVRDDMLTMTLPDAVYAAPLTGDQVHVIGPTGDDLLLSHRLLAEHTLLQQFTGNEGIRVNTCRRHGKDGLRIRVLVHSDKLPKAISYVLTFAKDS